MKNWELAVRNRQRSRRVAGPELRALTRVLLEDELGLPGASLAIHLISARAMAALNWQWLRHEGSTDILTFDLRADPADSAEPLLGELYISVDDAVAQSLEFGTTPSLELIRYVVHGVLHLLGHDDRASGPRRRMKRAENRLVKRLASQPGCAQLLGDA